MTEGLSNVSVLFRDNKVIIDLASSFNVIRRKDGKTELNKLFLSIIITSVFCTHSESGSVAPVITQTANSHSATGSVVSQGGYVNQWGLHARGFPFALSGLPDNDLFSGGYAELLKTMTNIDDPNQSRGRITVESFQSDSTLYSTLKSLLMRMNFQSWLEFLYPEYFGPCLPAGGGWHCRQQWQWKVRKSADNPPPKRGETPWIVSEKKGGTVRSTRTRKKKLGIDMAKSLHGQPASQYQRHERTNRPQDPIKRSPESVRELATIEALEHLKKEAHKYSDNYRGDSHQIFFSQLKGLNKFTIEDKLQILPFMEHLSKVITTFDMLSITVCIHSLSSTGFLATIKPRRGSGLEERKAIDKINLMVSHLIASLKAANVFHPPNGILNFSPSKIAQLIWSLGKIAEGGFDSRELTDIASYLLPGIIKNKERFYHVEVTMLLWGMARLIENRAPIGIFEDPLKALLPLKERYINKHQLRQLNSNLWALAKITDYGIPLGRTKQSFLQLLVKVTETSQEFEHRNIANMIWAIGTIVKNEMPIESVTDAVTFLTSKIGAMISGFRAQNVSNMLWAITTLTLNGLTISETLRAVVNALLVQAVNIQDQLEEQHIINISWAVSLFPDISGEDRQVVASLLRPDKSYTKQELSSYLFSMNILLLEEQSPAGQELILSKMRRIVQTLKEDAGSLDSLSMRYLRQAMVWLNEDIGEASEGIQDKKVFSLPATLISRIESECPDAQFEQDVMTEGLSNVSVLFRDNKVIIDFVSSSRVIRGKDGKTGLNKIMKLKKATYEKLGYTVFFIMDDYCSRREDYIDVFISKLKLSLNVK